MNMMAKSEITSICNFIDSVLKSYHFECFFPERALSNDWAVMDRIGILELLWGFWVPSVENIFAFVLNEDIFWAFEWLIYYIQIKGHLYFKESHILSWYSGTVLLVSVRLYWLLQVI